MNKDLELNSEIGEVCGLQLGILSDNEIKHNSVAHITSHETYSGSEPIMGGLFDSRLGTLDRSRKCATCFQRNDYCPGHFGHIELAKPCYNPNYITIIQKVLRCVCYRCSKILVDKNDSEVIEILERKNPKNRFQCMTTLCGKVKRCQHNNEPCDAVQPTRYIKENLRIFADFKDLQQSSIERKQYLSSEKVYNILRRISEEDCEILGFSNKNSRPEWMILNCFPVPPPQVRPSVRQDSSQQRCEDDLTHKLADIIKFNKGLRQKMENIPDPIPANYANIIDDWHQLLQYHCATFIDNEIQGIPPAQHRSGRVLRAIKQRLKSKEGRIRGNLMGKRVNYSARSVITPDPTLDIDELGVPMQVATNLTYPEYVTDFNKDYLYKLLRNGPKVHPGVKTIIQFTPSGNPITRHLDNIDTSKIELKNGDIVNRHLQDGDSVLFNRQPSLHRMSMMCHRARIMKVGSTFRLNVNVTTPYNADFDGDEMNMHVPQSIQSKIELRTLAWVPNQIISPQSHKPIIGLVQDTLLGGHLFTKNKNLMTRDQVYNILMWFDKFNGEIPPPVYTDNSGTQFWDGKQIMSLVLPNINLKIDTIYKNDNDSNPEKTVVIKKGQIIQGEFDKKIIGNTTGGIVHTLFNEYDNIQAKDFLDSVQKMITNWMLSHAYSIGVGDTVADPASKEKMVDIIKEGKNKVTSVISETQQGIMNYSIGKSTKRQFEEKINAILNKVRDDAGKLGVEQLGETNRLNTIVTSGSKGNIINISQTIACVGQQNVPGPDGTMGRIVDGFTNRTLPHFHKNDDSPEARGFVENSFMGGLTPPEFFFHAMGGRIGLIDTAVKTSETGYIQRRLIKSMEDLKVFYDGTVRNGNGFIVQFLYGDDGMEPTKLERQTISTFSLDNSELITQYDGTYFNWDSYLDTSSLESFTQRPNRQEMLKEEFAKILADRDFLRKFVFVGQNKAEVTSPINFWRLILNTKTTYDLDKLQFNDLDPCYIIEKVQELCKILNVYNNKSGTKSLRILLRSNLSSKKCIVEHRLNKLAFDHIVQKIKFVFNRALVSPGEMVGAIAAQSIGEPTTQMTLNTFHYAGVSSKSNVTRGVPRLKEIIQCAKTLKSPSCTVFLKNEYAKDDDKSHELQAKYEYTTMKELITKSEILYDNSESDEITTVEEDREFMESYKMFQQIDNYSSDSNSSKWLLRFEIDRETLLEKNLNMVDIHDALILHYKEYINCVYSDDNSGKLIFRLQINLDSDDDDSSDEIIPLYRAIEKTILSMVIKGVNNIQKIYLMKNKNSVIQADGSMNIEDEWVLDTNGTNLQEILNFEEVDYTRTYSNDINEINDLLGIEATRTQLVKELTEVIVFEQYVNYRHISLLADIMTHRGSLMSINRHGINRGDIGPLAKISFEEVPEVLMKSSVHGELDKLTGVSSNIIMGQFPPMGSTYCNIVLDEEKMIDNIPVNQEYEDEMDDDVEEENIDDEDDFEDSIISKIEQDLFQNSVCDQSNLEFKFNFTQDDKETFANQVKGVTLKIK